MGWRGTRRSLVRALLVAPALGLTAAGCPDPGAVEVPSDHTPEGVYTRIALAVAEGRHRDVFPYLEDEAQWAAYTIRKERQAALARAKQSFPQDELAALTAAYGVDATAEDGADVFARLGRARGWFGRLRRDLSGIARAEVDDDRATIVTVRGTRYPMRRRQNGIWGLTIFTAELVADAERATRDRARVDQAASDYDLASGKVTTGDAGTGGG